MKPRLFIGSSVEGLEVAYAVQQNLQHEVEATVWAQGVFELSKNTMESLSDSLENVDFGVFIFTPDDALIMRGSTTSSVRDNVLFELGLFIGKLGRDRVFFLLPEGSDIHIPSDLLGITPGKYSPNRADKNLAAATGAVCNQIRIQVKKIGYLHQPESINNATTPDQKSEADPDDWVNDIKNNQYQTAKTKLEKLLPLQDGEKLTEHETWLAYANLKLGSSEAKQKLIDLFNENKDIEKICSLIPKIFTWSGFYELAIKLALETVKHSPEKISAIETLAYCYENEGSYEEAIEALENSKNKTNPNIAIKLSKNLKSINEPHRALSALYNSYKQNQENMVITYELALAFDDLNYDKEALCLLSSLVNQDESNPDYWGYLSNSCLNLNFYDRAMIAAKKAESLTNSNDSWIILNIGNLYNNKGFYTEAIDWLNRGSVLSPNDQYAHDRLATAIKNKKDEQKQYTKTIKEGRNLINKFDPIDF